MTAVQRAGGAERGDRTLVDALAAVVDDADRRGVQALDEASALAAIEAAASTAEMVAGLGRAAYVGERAIGYPDAGAVAVAWLCATLWQAVTGADSAAVDTALENLLTMG